MMLRSIQLIFLLVAVLLTAASCREKKSAQVDPDVYYTCSMDPQVVEYKPGKCPICKMDLTPVKKRNGEKKDEIQLSEQQIRLGNIVTDTIRNGKIGDRMVLTGTLNFNQMKSRAVSSRVMGRIEKLYFRNQGDYVKKGAPLADIYSEELNAAKQEYLLALDRANAFKDETAIDFGQLLQSARNKLQLWGMTNAQLAVLEKTRNAGTVTTFFSTAEGYVAELALREGDYVMEGGTIVKLVDLSELWAEAQVYSSQLAQIDRNSVATVQLVGDEDKEVTGKIDLVNPEVSPETRINLLRVSIPNPGNRFKPGMPVYVVLQSPARNTLSLPVDAVIRDGTAATVWLRTGKSSFKNVMVKTGMESGDRIEILSGLSSGDAVVTSGAYLLNSEYIFKKGSDPMTGHNH
ncbi:efflux RND transporter periplasmic adaptor subunit [Flavihumibacter solisilvae]|uniref:Copper transporter n=1 Tax=Flavihumibacter solisilvae TaxID=1349421 RepID=A0A0C1L0Z6_9BACT|nr:efflux RND transporter periplasmic adaptor subunit [Flavihumibacter solisilvae]KIC93692.1 copper transporter [Flavihumibacter solisilvae]